MTLGLDRIDLLQLHRIDPNYPLADQIGELAKMQQEGKIRHIGLSQVSVAQIQAARKIAPIVSVQNRYNLVDRKDEAVLNYAEANHLAFIPGLRWTPGKLARGEQLQAIAKRYEA